MTPHLPQTARPTPRFEGRYGQVLQTYVQRPLFRALPVAAAACAALWGLAHSVDYALNGLLGLVAALATLFLVVGGVAAVVSHLRQQLRDGRSLLMPGFLAPHLLIAAGALLLLALGVPLAIYAAESPAYGQRLSLTGLLALSFTLVTLAAWGASFRSPWLALLLVPVWFLLLETGAGGRLIEGLVFNYEEPIYPHPTWEQMYYAHMERWTTVRVVLLVIDALALTALGLRILSRRPGPRLKLRTLLFGEDDGFRPAARERWAEVPTGDRARRQVTGLFSRAWQRRVAILAPGAPWLLAAVLAAVTLSIPLLVGHRTADPHQAMLLATLVPVIAAGMSWRERREMLAYESLYPARRVEFARETAVAVATDVAEFWVASMAAAMLPLLVWNRDAFHTPLFGASIAASAMMQVLAVGGTLWAARARTWWGFVMLMIILVIALCVPLAMAWAPRPSITPPQLLWVAGVELAAGVVIAGCAYVAWCRGDF